MTNPNENTNTENTKRDESFRGGPWFDRSGKYHGPSNQAGLTAREYWEMMEEWRDEQARLRDEW